MNKKKRIDPIPEEFADYEEAGEFWDTHDTTDYPDNFQAVDTIVEFRHRYYEIEIDDDLAKILQLQANQKGVTVDRLANDLLRQQLSMLR